MNNCDSLPFSVTTFAGKPGGSCCDTWIVRGVCIHAKRQPIYQPHRIWCNSAAMAEDPHRNSYDFCT